MENKKIKLKSAVDFLAEALEINKKSTAFRMAKEIEKERIKDALKMGVNFELGINEFKDLHLTYNQAFDKYLKDNYED
jgi:hypothetical protein